MGTRGGLLVDHIFILYPVICIVVIMIIIAIIIVVILISLASFGLGHLN